MHYMLVLYCCRGQLGHASQCTVMHERLRNKAQAIASSIDDSRRRVSCHVSHCPRQLVALLGFFYTDEETKQIALDAVVGGDVVVAGGVVLLSGKTQEDSDILISERKTLAQVDVIAL